MNRTESKASMMSDDSLLTLTSRTSSGMSRFSKWLRNAQPGGCARSPADGGLQIAPKAALKSRVCSVYESVFEGLDPSDGKGDEFWKEFWLLKVDTAHIINCVSLMTEQELLQSSVKSSINTLLYSAKETFCTSTNIVRRTRSLQTLTIFLYCVSRKQGWGNFAVDVLSVICGVSASQRFFKDILQAIIENSSKILTTSDKSIIALHDTSIGFLKSICCGNINCGSNPLLEIPVKQLSKSTFLLSALQRLTLDSSSPQHTISALSVLAILSKYEKYQLQESNMSTFMATLSGPGLNSLVEAINWTLDQFIKGQYEQSKTKTSSARSLSSFVTGVFYGGSAKGLVVEHEMFDPNNPDYDKIPTALASSLLLLLDLAQNNNFIEELLTAKTPLSNICPWSSDRTDEDYKTLCSRTLGRMFIALSIMMQLGKHPSISCAVGVFFRVWIALLGNRKFSVAVHSPDQTAYSIMEKGLHVLSPVAPNLGCRARDSDFSEGGVKVGILLRILQQYLALNQTGALDIPTFDLAFTIFNKSLFYQMENKIRLDWATDHFFERLFLFISALAAPGMVSNQPGARLLKKVLVFIKLLLRSPTVLFSEDFRLRFLHELVRCGGRLLALSKEIEREVDTATPVVAAMLEDSKAYLAHIIDFVARIELDLSQKQDCRGEREVVMQLIENALHEDETACRHKELWSVHASVYQELSIEKRDSSSESEVPSLRDLVARQENPSIG